MTTLIPMPMPKHACLHVLIPVPIPISIHIRTVSWKFPEAHCILEWQDDLQRRIRAEFMSSDESDSALTIAPQAAGGPAGRGGGGGERGVWLSVFSLTCRL